MAALGVGGFAASAIAHPGAPFRLPSEARAEFYNPGKGLYDDKSMRCTGVGEHSGARYRHFVCLSERNDGLRFSTVAHTLPPGQGEAWTFSDVHVLTKGQGGAKVFATGSASGANALAVAFGSTARPNHIEIAQYASPDQRISVTWSVTCYTGKRTDTKRGSYADFSGPSHEITIKPYAQPDLCAVSAYGAVRGGTVHLKLIAT